ncbi:F5/8 type C domain-containing protein [Actinoalloteichus sp. GBA129-24]|uniref:F5/8 type C domain-containing protein n=1 Tax=Actinoalloteichus fjordicus TaxID=1612552 RepID=A0AAC9LDM4_9PSEU|nr:F5/8 type C domain-containing protein [Actinoalloteichus fjordicus]APU21762.1 F5/8 type C domain-containing protein [Actinoalloteichus sp. GBA129-24]
MNGYFPPSLTVQLRESSSVGRVVRRLPPSTAWGTRTQTRTVQGSTNGSTFTTLAASQGHSFDPATGNSVTIEFPATAVRHLRVVISANTGRPAGQLAELEACRA